MSLQFQIRRGLKAELPVLTPGEFGLCEDTGELFIGSWDGNLPVRGQGGAGDMLRADYDANGDGTVNRADYAADAGTLDGKAPAAFATAAQGAKADAAVPGGRKINGKALSADISLAASDVGAVPTGRKVNGKALSADISLSAADVGALSAGGKASSAARADSVAWGNVSGKPSTFAPSSHTHDDRYFTESEMNTKLNGKANTSGTYGGLSVGYAGTAGCSGSALLDDGSHYVLDFGGTYLTKWLKENILHIQTGAVYCNDNLNSFFVPIYAAAFSQQSSRRYKEHIRALTEDEARRLLALEPVHFDYVNPKNGTDRFGLIAEDAYAVQPQGVLLADVAGQEAPDGIDYASYVPQLIKLCQLQQQHLEALEAQLAALEQQEAAL